MSNIARIKSLAVACPGQGIVARGCLYGVREHQRVFLETLECVDLLFNAKVSDILLQKPPTLPDPWSLSTANTQPAIVASTYVLVQILKDAYGIDLTSDSRVSFYLGHSLGEYTSLLLSGVISLPQALYIVRQRGLMMEELVREKAYEMRVLIFRPSAYDHIYKVAAAQGVLACANNASQISISGEPNVLDSVVEQLNLLKKLVLKQVTLPVTIPFHSKVLSAIEPELMNMLTDMKPPTKPIIGNLTGVASSDNVFSSTVKSNSAPVEWKASMEFLIGAGVDAVVNLGPGNAVDAINSKYSLANIPVKTVEDMKHLSEILKHS